MSIPFSCPQCGSHENAGEQYAGMTVPCKKCGHMVQVPFHNAGASRAANGSGVGMIILVVALVSLVVLMACGGILVALLLPAVQAARTAARRVQSQNHLKQIVLALHNYEIAYGEFPPAYFTDENGQPTHSWRVIILPFLEQQQLYNQYDFSQPWDSPANQAVAQSIPPFYRAAGDAPTDPLETNVLMFVGPGTLNDNNHNGNHRVLANITDGLSDTICIVESKQSGISWTQPSDLDSAHLDFLIHDARSAVPGQINAIYPGGVNVGFCDASIQFLSTNTPPAVLRKLVNPADGNAVALP
jgi:type II secretory pathway pseudopilin PulG